MSVLDQIYAKAKEDPQRVAFPEAENEKMMQAASCRRCSENHRTVQRARI